MCSHRLGNVATGLVCTRLDAHDPAAPGGHTYASTSGVAHAVKEEL